MKKVLLALACVFALSLSAEHPVIRRLRFDPFWDYQNIIINGEEIFQSRNNSGGRQIHARYATLKKVLSLYKRPFTVLDLGATNGYFSFKITEDFDASSTMVEGSERLTEICTLNTHRNKVIHFQKYFELADLKELIKREHFDVILAFHVLHHIGPEWKEWIDALFELGDNVFIETPPVNDPINHFEHTKELATYLTSLKNGQEIGRFHREEGIYDHMIWFCQNKNSFVMPPKRLGILTSTFMDFNGKFPLQTYVKTLNKRHKEEKVILQGVDYYTEKN